MKSFSCLLPDALVPKDVQKYQKTANVFLFQTVDCYNFGVSC